MYRRSWALLVSCCLILPGGATGLAAEDQKGPPKSPTAPPPVQAESAPQQPQIPNDYRLNLLIRTTVVALNQANQTGNYSVLRDLGAPGFQEANTPTRLAEIFASLRNSGFDLSPVLFFEPKLVRQPAIQPNGLLRLSGFFPTSPQQVNFDLAFQYVRGSWRLFGIALNTSAAPTANAPAAAAAAHGPAPKAGTNPSTKPESGKSTVESTPSKSTSGPRKKTDGK